jgi:hypothetical protein
MLSISYLFEVNLDASRRNITRREEEAKVARKNYKDIKNKQANRFDSVLSFLNPLNYGRQLVGKAKLNQARNELINTKIRTNKAYAGLAAGEKKHKLQQDFIKADAPNANVAPDMSPKDFFSDRSHGQARRKSFKNFKESVQGKPGYDSFTSEQENIKKIQETPGFIPRGTTGPEKLKSKFKYMFTVAPKKK